MSRTFVELQDESNVQNSMNTGGTSFATIPAGINAKRSPTVSDYAPQFTPWSNTVTNVVYMQNKVGQSSNWVILGAGIAGTVSSLTGTSGGAVSPLAGNINILGTANQIQFVGTANTLTASLLGPFTPATFTAHGVLIGEGSSSIVASAVGTDGQVLTGNSAADPTFDAIGTKSGLTAHGVVLAEGASAFAATAAGTNGQFLTGSTGANPVFSTLLFGPGLSGVAGAGTLTLSVAAGGLAINSVAGTTQAIVAGNSYISNNAGLTTFTLPAVAVVGATFQIIGSGAAFWTIAQNAGQEIKYNAVVSTVGVTGSLTSTQAANTIEIMCTVANTTWTVLNASGAQSAYTVV
jgi:hypothetical protein